MKFAAYPRGGKGAFTLTDNILREDFARPSAEGDRPAGHRPTQRLQRTRAHPSAQQHDLSVERLT